MEQGGLERAIGLADPKGWTCIHVSLIYKSTNLYYGLFLSHIYLCDIISLIYCIEVESERSKGTNFSSTNYFSPFTFWIYLLNNIILMNCDSDISTLILPSDLSAGDSCPAKSQLALKLAGKARWNKLVVGGITTMLLVGMLCALYFYLDSQGSLEKERVVGQTVDLGGSHRLIIDSDQMDFLKEVEFLNVREVIVRNFNLRVFDTTPFPSLESLIIEPNVRLDDLVVNNTQLKDFSYNSSDLKTLKLINNAKMVRFHNSKIPSLTHLYVTTTPITTWTNNKLDSLIHLQFTDSEIQKLPLTDTHVKTLILTNCGEISNKPNTFSKYSSLQSVKIDKCDFDYNSSFVNMAHLKSIVITSSYFSDDILISDCNKLEQLNISSQGIDSLLVKNTPSLSIFSPIIQSVQHISLIQTSVSQFTIKTNRLMKLTIGGTVTKKVQGNIQELEQVRIINSSMNNEQFSALQFPHLKTLHIESCSQLSTLKNSFPNLAALEVVNQVQLDFYSINAPQLISLDIEGGSFSIIDTTPFKKLSYVELSKLKLMNLTLSDTTANLVLDHIENLSTLSFNTTGLQFLDIDAVHNLVISGKDFPKLEKFQISVSSNISLINNTFSNNLGYFLLENNTGELNFHSNTFAFDIKVAAENIAIERNELTELKQELTGCEQIRINANLLNDLGSTMRMLPKGRKVVAQSNRFERIANVTHSAVSVLNLDKSSNLVSFEDNQFTGLTQLHLSNSDKLTSFSNNKVPKLTTLTIYHCTGLSEDTILNEFSLWAQAQTNLLKLTIENRGKDFDDKIKQIFPHVDIRRL